MTGCAQHATTIILQVRQYAIGLIVIHQNPLEVTIEDKVALHGATNDEAETVEIGVRTKHVKVIGPVKSVATLTLHLGPNVIDVELRRTARKEAIHPTRSLEETTREEFAD